MSETDGSAGERCICNTASSTEWDSRYRPNPRCPVHGQGGDVAVSAAAGESCWKCGTAQSAEAQGNLGTDWRQLQQQTQALLDEAIQRVREAEQREDAAHVGKDYLVNHAEDLEQQVAALTAERDRLRQDMRFDYDYDDMAHQRQQAEARAEAAERYKALADEARVFIQRRVDAGGAGYDDWLARYDALSTPAQEETT